MYARESVTFFGYVVGWMIGLSIIVALIGGLFIYFGNPFREEVRRTTMLESRLYEEHTIRSLYKYKREYEAATDPQERLSIAAAARHEFSIFEFERLPADLQLWFNSIR